MLINRREGLEMISPELRRAGGISGGDLVELISESSDSAAIICCPWPLWKHSLNYPCFLSALQQSQVVSLSLLARNWEESEGTRSGPKRPAAAIGGGDFWDIWLNWIHFGSLTEEHPDFFKLIRTHGLLKLVVRRLEFHRNSGFFQANSSRLFWPPNGLWGHLTSLQITFIMTSYSSMPIFSC